MENRFAQTFIVPRGLMIFFVFLIAIIGGIEYGAAQLIKMNTVTARDAVCMVKGFDHDGSTIVMKLDCGGQEDEIRDVSFIATYLQKRGPFTCTRYAEAPADCKLTEAVKK